MKRDRREFFRRTLLGAGLFTGTHAAAGQQGHTTHDRGVNAQHDRHETAKNSPGSASGTREPNSAFPAVLVQTPDVPDLPFALDNGVKVFHLVAEPVKQQILPTKTIDAWGFNGHCPGPTIQVNQGDRVRIVVDNHLPEPTSMHWHGFEIPINMDGAPSISQELIKPGGRFVYEFTLHQEGTYFYHSHMAMQEMMGMLGAFIMHPKDPYEPRVDKDFVILLQEFAVLPNSTVPNSMNMEFNWLLFNGKAGPAITPLIVRLGERIRIRLINLGMDHHPIHAHGHTFYVTGTEGGRIPSAAWIPGNTVLVGVAQARDIEFVASNPGDWMLHCHLPHHMMNQMSSNVGPMTRLGAGMPAGVGMEEGMGMLRGTPGAPTGDDYGPSLGRGLGVGSTSDERTSNGPLSERRDTSSQHAPENRPGMQQEGMAGMHMHDMQADVAPDANKIPGFPQDAFMSGPMMNMDRLVEKPQNYGLRPGWSSDMQGMMTLIRVLPPDKYDEMMARIRQVQPQSAPESPEHDQHLQRGNTRSGGRKTNPSGLAILLGVCLLSASSVMRSQGLPQTGDPSAGGHTPAMEITAQERQSSGKPESQRDEHAAAQKGIQVLEPDLLQDARRRPPMKLEDFSQLALRNNPTLKQANDLVRRSAGQARQAGLFPNPMVGYQGEQIRGGSQMGGEHGAFIQQTIVLGGKLGRRRRVFEEQRREDELGVIEQRYRLTNDVAQRFYSALAAQETVRVRQKLVHLAMDAVETAHQLANIGQADTPDVLQAEVEAEQAQLDYGTAQRAFIENFRQLASLVGEPDLPLAILEGDLERPPQIDRDHVIQTIVENGPSVKRVQQAVAKAQAGLRSAKRDSVPDLLLRAGLQQNFEPLGELSNREVGLQGFATIGINIPVFNRNQGNVQAARAEVERAQAEVMRVQLSLREAAHPHLERYLAQQDQANRYKNEMIPRAARAYQLYLNKYRQMASAYPQVIVSQRTLFQLQVGYIHVLREMWLNAMALQNFTLSGGLSSPLPSGEPTSVNVPTGAGGSEE